MQHLPELCISICGAVALVALVSLPALIRTLRSARDYVTIQDVPAGDGEYLA